MQSWIATQIPKYSMATTTDDIKALRAYFVSVWPSSVPFIFDNEPPVDEGTVMWARFSIIPNQTTTIGFNKRVRETGRVYLHLFVPRGTGNGVGQPMVDAFKTAFHQTDLDNYRIRLLECQSGVSDDDPKFYTLSATVRYQADH